MLIVTIDPGTRDLGICFGTPTKPICAYTLTISGKDAYQRMLAMKCRVFGAIASYSHTYGEVQLAYEDPQFFEGTWQGMAPQARPIVALQQLVAVLHVAALDRDFEVFPYRVGDIKEGVAGKKTATKGAVQRVLQLEYPDFPDAAKMTDHAYDALSVYVYHLAQRRITAAMQTG